MATIVDAVVLAAEVFVLYECYRTVTKIREFTPPPPPPPPILPIHPLPPPPPPPPSCVDPTQQISIDPGEFEAHCQAPYYYGNWNGYGYSFVPDTKASFGHTCDKGTWFIKQDNAQDCLFTQVGNDGPYVSVSSTS